MRLLIAVIGVAFVSLIAPAFAEMNIDVVVDGLNNPWEMVFAPNGDIYFSERDGRIWKIESFGEAKVIQTFPKSGSYEGGTLGLALHPNFEENKKIYVYQTNLELEFFQNKVFSFTVDGDIFSYGHRNPQGIAWSNDGLLVSSEHGPSGEMGYGHDEINVIVKGKNYGWPKVVGDSSDDSFVNPIIHSGQTTWAPSGMVYFDSNKIPSLDGKFLVGALRGQHLMVVDVANDGSLVSAEKMFEGEFGRIRTAQIGPDGVLYLLTANGDNDKIVRISEAPVVEVEKFTSSESESDQTILYGVIGVIVVGAIIGGIILKRKR